MDEVRIGLLGLGVVGAGVARTLEEKADTIARRAGRPLTLAKVLVREPGRLRDYQPRAPLTADAREIQRHALVFYQTAPALEKTNELVLVVKTTFPHHGSDYRV